MNGEKYMPLSFDESTKSKLLKAGIKVFAEKGYKDATVREICSVAESSNINSINYYFGSKELLYKKILDLMFSQHDITETHSDESISMEERLRIFILTSCERLYGGGEIEFFLMKIFVSETVKPSSFLSEFVDKYNRPRAQDHINLIRGLVGHDKPEDVVRNCIASIAGQILYYAYSWPALESFFEDYTRRLDYKKLADHIYNFSIGGIRAIQTNR
jgi:AcrR family transcriptional regulator